MDATVLSPMHFAASLVVLGIMGAPDVAFVAAFIMRALLGDGLPALREFCLIFAQSLDSCPVPTTEVLLAHIDDTLNASTWALKSGLGAGRGIEEVGVAGRIQGTDGAGVALITHQRDPQPESRCIPPSNP